MKFVNEKKEENAVKSVRERQEVIVKEETNTVTKAVRKNIKARAEEEALMIHTFHLRGQLEHKFPESMGGVRWVPGNDSEVEIKIHDVTPFGDNLKFEVFTNEDEGRKKSQTGWFWVIEPDVELLEGFDLDFIPKIWDKGKKHVWQKKYGYY